MLRTSLSNNTEVRLENTAQKRFLQQQQKIISLRVHNSGIWALCADGSVWYKSPDDDPVETPWRRVPDPQH